MGCPYTLRGYGMFQKKIPGEGKKKAETWTFEKVPGGSHFTAWLAGPTEWVEVHHIGVSKPCHWEITGGRKECPHCRRKPRKDLVGYVPLYRENGKPVVVLVPEYSADIIRRIQLHDAVRVMRGTTRGDAVSVTKLDKGERYKPATAERSGPVGLEGWLLRFWRETELEAWFRDNGMSPAKPAEELPASDGKTVPATLDLARAAGKAELQAIAPHVRNRLKAKVSEFADGIGEVPDVERNGHHKPR